MTDLTVLDQQQFGSVETYLGILRSAVRRVENLDGAVLAIVRVLAADEYLDAAQKVVRIHRLVAAGELIADEADKRDVEVAELQAQVADLEQRLAGYLDEENRRAKAEVIANLRSGEHGRITNPNLARFLAHREDASRSPS